MTKRFFISMTARLLAFTATLSVLTMADNQKLRRENLELHAQLVEAARREEAHICPEPEVTVLPAEEPESPVVEPEASAEEPDAPVAEAKPTETAADIPEGLTWIENVSVSHYDACALCCGSSGGIGASGRKVVPHYSVAVDPSVIPLGSDVVIMFDNGETLLCRADDTGGAVKGNKIDLCVATHEEAVAAGVRKATVGYLPPVKNK